MCDEGKSERGRASHGCGGGHSCHAVTVYTAPFPAPETSGSLPRSICTDWDEVGAQTLGLSWALWL